MKLKESLEEYLDSLNYSIGVYKEVLKTDTLSTKVRALKFVSKELGFILDNFLYLGVNDEDIAERICHYIQIREFTINESRLLKMRLSNELSKLHKYVCDWEEEK